MRDYFFDIPVYRLSEFDYEAEYSNYLAACPILKRNKDFYDKYPDLKTQFLQDKSETFGGMWRYNEIIGYIRLYILGSQIRGWYFENDVKRHYRSRKKQFVYRTHKLAPEVELLWPWDNEEIFCTIRLYLDDCKKELSRRRFVDTNTFDLVGPHIDWKNLFSSFKR